MDHEWGNDAAAGLLFSNANATGFGAAGANILKQAGKTFWGGYDGYFADPDGHVWKVAHNPFWTLDEDGRVRLPD